MILAQVFAAWLLINHGDASTTIPFDSFQQCQTAREEFLKDSGYNKGVAVCIHGKGHDQLNQ